MESWDIAYEPRTGRRNHRATFPHLSSFLRFSLFLLWCRRTPTANHFRTSHYRQDSLFGPNACESIELKRILSLKLFLRWKKEVKFFLYTFFFSFFSFVFLEKWFVESLHRQMITFSAKYSSCRTLENWFWDNYRR